MAIAVAPPPPNPAEEACRQQADPEKCLAELHAWYKAAARAGCATQHGAKRCDEFERTAAEGAKLYHHLDMLYRSLLDTSNEHNRKELEESQQYWLRYVAAECTSRSRMLYRKGDDWMYLTNTCRNDLYKARTVELTRRFCQRPGDCR